MGNVRTCELNKKLKFENNRLSFDFILKMAAISMLNPKAEVARAAQALAVNISAAKGIQEVLKTNLGPRGTMKMLVSGAGDIKITKDGNVLLHEMQIQHPTASLIARASTAQDDITGDGTTSTVLLIGEFLKQADTYISEGLHPRIVTEGFEMAKDKALEVLESVKIPLADGDKAEVLQAIAQTSLGTKVHPVMAEQLTPIVVEAVQAIHVPEKPIDLHMVEMIIPKTLAANAGYDSQEVMVKLLEEARDGASVGMDCDTGEACIPKDKGIYDNYRVKRQMVNSCTVIASNLLLVDEIMRAGMSSLKG